MIRPHKPLPSRRAPLKRSGKPRSSNAARKRREFARAYGSKARVEWVKTLPCVACGIVGCSENAHTKNGGGSRKAHYTTIVPLCGPHPCGGQMYIGCHAYFDQRVFRTELRADIARDAEKIEAAWQAHCGQEEG